MNKSQEYLIELGKRRGLRAGFWFGVTLTLLFEIAAFVLWYNLGRL